MPHGYREEDFFMFFCFSYYKSMGANDPRGMANLDPSDMFDRIYENVDTHRHTDRIRFDWYILRLRWVKKHKYKSYGSCTLYVAER